MKRLLGLSALMLLISAAHADSMSIIQLQNRTAEEVIPIVEPLLGAGDAISGQGFNIFLRSSPQTLTLVKDMIAVLDTPAKMLQVSVFQGSERDLSTLGVSANIQIKSGNASVDVGSGTDNNNAAGGSITYGNAGSSASVSGIRTQESVEDNPVHHVRVTEGTEAYIETGEQIPYFYGPARTGRGGFAGGVEYKDVVTGFYVLPRIRGDNVILEVSPFKSSRSNTGGDNIDVQSADTTITGRIGEWLLIGGVTEQMEQTRSEIGTTTTTQSSGNASIWIRADLAR
jgi:type II secretory pathway component GspD/PulD (secretin)